MITGFTYNTITGEWLADYTSKNGKMMFKQLYKNSLGYLIKTGKKEMYLTDEQAKEFEKQRKQLKKQLQ